MLIETLKSSYEKQTFKICVWPAFFFITSLKLLETEVCSFTSSSFSGKQKTQFKLCMCWEIQPFCEFKSCFNPFLAGHTHRPS